MEKDDLMRWNPKLHSWVEKKDPNKAVFAAADLLGSQSRKPQTIKHPQFSWWARVDRLGPPFVCACLYVAHPSCHKGPLLVLFSLQKILSVTKHTWGIAVMFESSWFSVLFLSGEQGKPFRQPCGFTNICGWWKRYPKARVKFAACGWLASLEPLHVDFKEIGSSLEKGKSSVFKETLQVFGEDFCSWNGFPSSPRIPSRSINEFLETISIISTLGSLVTGARFAP